MNPEQNNYPMPKRLLILHIASFCISLLLFTYTMMTDLLNKERANTIIVSIMLTLAISSLTQLLPEWSLRRSARHAKGKFIEFFGEATMTDKIILAFPHFRTASGAPPDWVYANKVNERIQTINTRKSDTECTSQHPIPKGTIMWLSMQDAKSATAVANMFHEFTDRGFDFVASEKIQEENIDKCLVSFGLGFNPMTLAISELLNPQLFSITFSKNETGVISDEIVIEGKMLDTPREGHDNAIIVRFVKPAIGRQRQRVYFVCAGRTAHGTVAAGVYLANCWEELYNLYKTENHSLKSESLVSVIESHKSDYSQTSVIRNIWRSHHG